MKQINVFLRKITQANEQEVEESLRSLVKKTLKAPCKNDLGQIYYKIINNVI